MSRSRRELYLNERLSFVERAIEKGNHNKRPNLTELNKFKQERLQILDQLEILKR